LRREGGKKFSDSLVKLKKSKEGGRNLDKQGSVSGEEFLNVPLIPQIVRKIDLDNNGIVW